MKAKTITITLKRLNELEKIELAYGNLKEILASALGNALSEGGAKQAASPSPTPPRDRSAAAKKGHQGRRKEEARADKGNREYMEKLTGFKLKN